MRQAHDLFLGGIVKRALMEVRAQQEVTPEEYYQYLVYQGVPEEQAYQMVSQAMSGQQQQAPQQQAPQQQAPQQQAPQPEEPDFREQLRGTLLSGMDKYRQAQEFAGQAKHYAGMLPGMVGRSQYTGAVTGGRWAPLPSANAPMQSMQWATPISPDSFTLGGFLQNAAMKPVMGMAQRIAS